MEDSLFGKYMVILPNTGGCFRRKDRMLPDNLNMEKDMEQRRSASSLDGSSRCDSKFWQERKAKAAAGFRQIHGVIARKWQGEGV